MVSEAMIKMEDGRRRRNDRLKKIAAVVVFLIVNSLAIYRFQSISKMQSYSEGIREGSLQEGSKIAEEQSTIIRELRSELREVREQLVGAKAQFLKAKKQLVEAQEKHKRIVTEMQATVLAHSDKESIEKDPYHRWMLDRRSSLPAELREYVTPRKLQFGFNSALRSDHMTATVGHACVANVKDITKFMSYEVGKVCPDDESLAQTLLLAGCEPLPRRRCLARGLQNPTEPLPLPDSLWTVPDDGNINWKAYDCKSFECLNTRAARKVFADCLDCFDLHGLETHRWVARSSSVVDYTIEEVVALKNGSLRIGLDIGGGTASFAVRMREHNVTIITSTLNLNGPFNNFIAQRGVIPFFMSIGERFPFWDNTLDIVHSMHVLSNWIPLDVIEFIFYDIDRILRPGGILWLDRFFCIQSELDTKYAPLIRKLGYKELRWDVGKKLDRGPERQEVYLSALLEKPFTVRN